jgi:predicted PurR-regulated permease PerM
MRMNNDRRMSSVSMLFLVALFGYLSYLILKPFLSPLLWAIVLSILFYPVYAFILKYVRIRNIAAAVSLLIIILIILGPVSYLSFLLVRELAGLREYFENGAFEKFKELQEHPLISRITGRLTALLNISTGDLYQRAIESLSELRSGLISALTRGVGDIVLSALNFAFMSVALFIFLKDGPEFLSKIRLYLPFSETQKNRLMKQISDIVVANLYGGFIIAVVEGVLGGIGFAVVGLSSPVLWGFAMAVASFMPIIGPFAIWVPAAVYLMVTGELARGIGLAVYGFVIIGLADNVLRPIVVGKRTQMHFLVLFFSLLGGIKLFGLLGLILGPLIIAIFISMLQIARTGEEKKQA